MAINLIFTVAGNRFCLNDDLLQDRSSRLLDLLDQADRQLSIVFLDDQSMAEYNFTYRSKKWPTNVLSFPAADLQADLPRDLAGNELGDILISVETALCEARKNNTSLHYRITELIIHGILHLLGYDHEESSHQARVMWEKEQQLLTQLF
ncbi:MAG: rRNA maturation RNase YbeY, partial [Deltaproteobacteria bacterium]|nr:rRNA maturation RNase YbeY [Deltaproteobacteria bacterium]